MSVQCGLCIYYPLICKTKKQVLTEVAKLNADIWKTHQIKFHPLNFRTTEQLHLVKFCTDRLCLMANTDYGGNITLQNAI